MAKKMKANVNVDVDYLTKVLKLSENEKKEFFVELYRLIKSKGMVNQFLEVSQRTLSAEALTELRNGLSKIKPTRWLFYRCPAGF
ncbi:hypothetical protein [Lactococcus lactis]|uniref:hypothetical protein n=1 Tax=Lactococcus lactis TaxID=1358 RepID=UPI00204F43A3|nr:hypothetical protein [Lactococcus lactis]BDH82185.1 hypothetical protein LLL8_18420 [Lactococcus lactis]